MGRPELMRRHFAAVLMDLCETRRLRDITVTDLVEAAETARQTFYNHFIDINDLICYTAFLPFSSVDGPFTDTRSTYNAYAAVVKRKAFFCQLPQQTGQNNVWVALRAWLCDTYRERFVTDDLPEDGRHYRRVCIDLYCSGSVQVFRSWCENGMDAPVETLVDVMYDMSPPFVREERERLAGRYEDYPR